MKKFEIEVQQVTGHCTCSYQQGDCFYCSGYNTPDGEFCGGAFMTLYPIMVALHSGARFEFNKNPLSMANLACPDKGNVHFQVKLVETDE